MNFWIPQWSPWGDDRNDSNMPWHVDYDWVEVWKYNSKTKGFDWYFKDDFNGDTLNNRWNVSNYAAINGTYNCYHPSCVQITGGNLRLLLKKDTKKECKEKKWDSKPLAAELLEQATETILEDEAKIKAL